MMFEPTRSAALSQLETFLPNAGRAYAATRNTDSGPDNRKNVSVLSPYIRHRLISEGEVVSQTLKRHSFGASEKFIQEVFWRAYFKGWLEQRPDVWTWYCEDLENEFDRLEQNGGLRSQYSKAVSGSTGIECFDFWAKELVETGYLHNHARMWFASIWIFTLGLPWQLGADFFYRNLLDGDPASNTCSWRWVGGLHTKGKHYVARASNIERFTDGRFKPTGQLNENPLPLTDERDARMIPPPTGDAGPEEPFTLIVTDEDCLPETLPLVQKPEQVIGLSLAEFRSRRSTSEQVTEFSTGAVEDALRRCADTFGCDTKTVSAADLENAISDAGSDTIVTAWHPVGSGRDKLTELLDRLRGNGMNVRQILRNYDRMAWPHATKGFFKLKEKVPKLIAELDLG